MSVRTTPFAYRLLLFSFPAALRHEFGADMAAMFAMQIDERRRQRRSLAGLWIRAVGDVLQHGMAERFGAGGSPRPRRKGGWMQAFLQDARYALRMMNRQRGVTLVCVLTLALGIGANTAIFSAVNAFLLRPLPYDDPSRIMTIWEKRAAEGVLDNVVAPADFLDWARQNSTFESMAAQLTLSVDLTGAGEPQRLFAGAVSPSFFNVLRVRPILGRDFRTEESVAGKPRVAILSHRLWSSQFGRDAGIVGRTLTLNSTAVEVVGVLPASFEFPDERVDLWTPLILEGTPQPQSRSSHQLVVYGRLKAGVTVEQARADMERIGAALQQQYPDTNRNHGAWVIPYEQWLKGPVRSSLLLLLGAVAFVLLIACVNVANILLAKSAGRRREIAVRSAVGAGRARLAGQMLTESVMLAGLGGLGGLLIGWWGIQALKQLAPTDIQIVGWSHLRLEPRVLAFTAVIALATGILFGLLPAWQLASQDVGASLKEGGRSPGGVRRRVRVALVVSEIALASLLLVAAGLTLRSFQSVLEEPAGFRIDRSLTVNINLTGNKYRSREAVVATFESIEQRLASIPGVRGVGETSHLPLGGRDGRQGVTIEGREPTPDTPTRAHPRVVSPSYFRTMRIQLLAGRSFSGQDGPPATPVVIVNETMARRYWPGASPINKRVRFNGTNDPWMAVVGVIADVKHWGLDARVNPEIYLPLKMGFGSTMTYVIDSDLDGTALAGSVREQIRATDPNLPVGTLRTMEDVASVSVGSRRAGMLLVTVFGLLALLLAAAGIHGVMSHLVALRTPEIGVRMTLGATPAQMMTAILREGAIQAIAGLAVGLGSGVLLMRTFRSVLYGVEPADPLTLMVVSLTLLATALAASTIPGRRAMRIDPVNALRGS